MQFLNEQLCKTDSNVSLFLCPTLHWCGTSSADQDVLHSASPSVYTLIKKKKAKHVGHNYSWFADLMLSELLTTKENFQENSKKEVHDVSGVTHTCCASL